MVDSVPELVDVRISEGAAFISLESPPVNALSVDLVSDLEKALKRISSDVDAMVLTSGLKLFAAGADLKALSRISTPERLDYFRAVGDLFHLVETLPCWTVSLVRGRAIGAGADLSLACDHVLADSSASWSFPGYRLGLRLGVERLRARIGPGRSLRLLALGDQMSQAQAVEWGVASPYTDDRDLIRTVEALIEGHGSPTDLRSQLYGRDSAKRGRELLEKSLTGDVVDRFMTLNKQGDKGL